MLFYAKNPRNVLLILLAVMYFLFSPFALAADAELTADSSFFSIAVFENDFNPKLSGLGRIHLGAAYSGNRNLKGELEVQGDFPVSNGETPSLSVSKAYLKARFDDIRLTAGKAPISWSDGLVFNAGDRVLNIPMANTDLAASEISDAYLFQNTVSWYFSSFSFLEGILLPGSSLDQDSADFAAGARGQFIPGSGGSSLKLESGALFQNTGGNGSLRAYASVQGNLEVDYFLGIYSSANLDKNFTDAAYANMGVTAGFYTSIPIGFRDMISIRAEGEILPDGIWEKKDTGLGADSYYGLQLYTDVSYPADSTMDLMLRSMISPIDLSALLIPGVIWKPMEGFSLIGTASIALGSLEPEVYGLPSLDEEKGMPRMTFSLGTELKY
ncbi:MAG: hypothetical protein K9L75_06185 [Spirochaetia bacterium]|nr:hypothetical protein [Spirochaetia bacterium]